MGRIALVLSIENCFSMKKSLIVLVFLAISFSGRAQVNSIGPTLGLNYAWLSEEDNPNARPSYNIGFLYNHSILESSGVGIEVRYSQEGSKTKFGNQTFTNELNYVRIPLEFIYYFGALEDNFRPKIFLGPSLAFLVGGESKIQVGENVITVDSKDLFEPFDVGLQAGAGFNYRLAKSTWLNFNVAYTHGFLKVYSQNIGAEPQNRLVNVNLGIAFGF